MTIKVNKINNPQFDLVERVAINLSTTADGFENWRKIDGVFTLPYSEVPFLFPDVQYFCDDVTTVDGQPRPLIWAWRTFGSAAQRFLEACHKSDNLKVLFNQDQKVKVPNEDFEMEIITPQKEPEVVPKYSKEATDVEGV